jgi:hypothetical protein
MMPELDEALKSLIRDVERLQLLEPEQIAAELGAWQRNDGSAQSIRSRLMDVRVLAALDARNQHPEWSTDELVTRLGASSRSHAFKLVALGRDLLVEQAREVRHASQG